MYFLLRASLDASADTGSDFFYTGFFSLAVLCLVAAQVKLCALVLAVVSGAVILGMGYALWYPVLPRLSTAATYTTQLSLPVLAAFEGLVFN